MTPYDESRPEAANPGAAKTFGGVTAHSTDVVAAMRRADYALLVVSGLRGGGMRRRTYFSLPSAQRALDNAAARGVPASLTLIRLVPAGVVDLDELEGGAIRG